MNPRGRSVAFALVAIVLGVGGWLATLWAASERWAGVAFAGIALLLIAAAFRGRFASRERARDFWTGFALFGLVHTLMGWPDGSQKAMTSAVVDLIGDRVLGVDAVFPNDRKALTPLGDFLAARPIETGVGPLMYYLPYLRKNTKLFAGLAFAGLGGFVACHLRRRAFRGPSNPRLGGCPPLGMAWLCLLAGLIGGALILHAHPDLVFDNGFFPEWPGSEAAHFTLFNVELMAVLFAALEARFAIEAERPWWIGFALFGGAYLLSIDGSLAAILPTKWMVDLFQWVYYRFISDSSQPAVAVRGIILMDYETGSFFRSGFAWTALATFLPVAWLGTLAARLARRLGEPWTGPNRLGFWRIRSSIGRLMVVMAAIGIILAAFKDPTDTKVAVLGDATVGLLLVAALRASFGPSAWRPWWWGFALVGGIDLLIGAKQDNLNSPWQMMSTAWPIHEAASHLHRLGFERFVGERVPNLPMFDVLEERRMAVYNAYHFTRPIVLMGLCLPMGWIGAILASRIDRRRRTADPPGEFSQ